MQFLWPSAFGLLAVVPVLVLFYVWMQRRRQKYALRYASLSLVREALGRGPGLRRHIPPAIFLLSLTAMIVALARPVTIVSLPSNEGTVILTIDVSGSMMADDVQPSRMEAAKSAARTFVEKQSPGVRIGVVSFTDNASIVQAPTNDRDAVLAAINRLTPQRGTAIGRGILTSLDAIFEGTDSQLPSTKLNPFAPTPGPGSRGGIAPAPRGPTPTPRPKGQFAPALIVLLTDGENNQFPAPLDVVDQAVDRGIRIYTVGLGSAEGTILRIQGRAIRTRLDETTLKQIAQETDAEYFNAANESELQAIYANLSTHLVMHQEKTEITALMTAIAAVLSLLAGILSLLWFNRLP